MALAIAVMVAANAVGSDAKPVATAAPGVEPRIMWAAHDPRSTATIDHAAFDDLLATYRIDHGSDEPARFAYARVSDEDRRRLADYVQALEAVDIAAFNRNEQFAYWANLYNAATLQLVLDHYPVRSIRDIGGLLAVGPWRRALVTVNETRLSLDDIEHAILRPLWRDPRVHYAVNCASIGCPSLNATAFTGAHLDAQLDQAARAFVNSPRGVRIDADARLAVSSIYAWFRDDFGGSEAAVIDHLRAYAEPDLAAALAGRGRIDSHDFDWSLNSE